MFYDTVSNAMVHRLKAFQQQPIHGMHVSVSNEGPKVLVWGSSSVAAFEADYTRQIKVARAQAPDWIYDGVFSPSNPSEAILVTAHNEVIQMHYNSDANALRLEDKVISPSRPMLYTAKATWTADNEVLVAAGTVFGDILVWKHVIGNETPQMLFSLSGHEGSIFGVDISQPLRMPDGSDGRLLLSCSDDRTIRVWNITERNDTIEKPVPSETVLDTGFRCAPEYNDDSFDQGRVDTLPIAMEMGHASRIWGVKFAAPSEPMISSNKIPIYSFGEDATTQRWSLDVAAALDAPCSLVHEKTFSLHNGKHLWSQAILCENQQTVIATGGADSRISLIREGEDAKVQDQLLSGLITIEASDVFENTATARSKKTAELISRYDFLTDTDLIAVTNTGRIATGQFAKAKISWREVPLGHMVEDLKNCYVLRTSGHGSAVIGSTSGNLYYFRLPDMMVHVATLGGRIAEINTLSSTTAQDGEIEVLAHLHGKSTSQYITLDASTGALKSQLEAQGLDERFVAVSACRFGDLIAIGSRHGWLSIMKRCESTFECILDVATRSRDAITSIVPLPNSKENTDSATYLVATSRDGKYRIYDLHHTEELKLTLIHETALPFGPMIEGAWFTDDKKTELIMYGFRSKDFIVWNETRREEVASMDCGGAHRTFRLAHSNSVYGQCRFAFTRTSKLLIHSQAGVSHFPLKLGTHGREIRAIASNGTLIATGAEDTSIRLWEYDHEQAQMRQMASMKTHITGIQRIQWLGNEYLFSSAGNEEFFVWKVTRLHNTAYEGVAVMCEGVFQDKSPIGDLRIMDFDVSWKQDVVVVTMAFSNSTFKTYEYAPGQGTFRLCCQGAYTGACLLQMRHLFREETLLTASTDGCICIWRLNPDTANYELGYSLKVHQSSIKSLDLVRTGNSIDVLTGGDDNALGYVTLSIDDQGNVTVKDEFGPQLVRSAHAAAINGVAIVKPKDDNAVGVSVSNDQQIKLWKMQRGQGMRLLKQAYSGVADAGDLVALEGAMMLGGVGVEVWRI